MKVKLHKSLIVSTFLYGCESWTITAETERRIQAFEMKCLRKLLGISYREHRTNESVRQEVEAVCGKFESLLETVKRRKLKWFGHVCRHDSLSKTILQGTVAGGRKRGRPRKSWLDNIKEWTGRSTAQLIRKAEDRPLWTLVTVESCRAAPTTSGHGTD